MSRNPRQPNARSDQDEGKRVVRKIRNKPSRATPYYRPKPNAKPQNIFSKMKNYVYNTIPFFFSKSKRKDIISQDVTVANGLEDDRVTPGEEIESKYERLETKQPRDYSSALPPPSRSLSYYHPSDSSTSTSSSSIALPPLPASSSYYPPPHPSTTSVVLHGDTTETSYSSEKKVPDIRTRLERRAFQDAFQLLEEGRKFAPEEAELLMSIVQRNINEGLAPPPPIRYPSRYPTLEKSAPIPSPHSAQGEDGRSKYSFPTYTTPTPFTRSSLWSGVVPAPTPVPMSVTPYPIAQSSLLSPVHGIGGISGIASSSPTVNGIGSSSTLGSTASPFGTPRASIREAALTSGAEIRVSHGTNGEYKVNGLRDKSTATKLDFESSGTDVSFDVYQPPMRTSGARVSLSDGTRAQASSEAAEQVLRTLTHLGTPLFDSKKLRVPLPGPQPRFRINSPSFDRTDPSSTTTSDYETGKGQNSLDTATTKGSPPLPATTQRAPPVPAARRILEKKALKQGTEPVAKKPLPLTTSKQSTLLAKKLPPPKLISKSTLLTKTNKKISTESAPREPTPPTSISNEPDTSDNGKTPFTGFNLVPTETVDENAITRGSLPSDIRAEKSKSSNPLNWGNNKKDDFSSGKITKKRAHSTRSEKPATKKRGLVDDSGSEPTTKKVNIGGEESVGHGSSETPSWNFGSSGDSGSVGEEGGFNFGGADEGGTSKQGLTVSFDNPDVQKSPKRKKVTTTPEKSESDPTFGGFGDAGGSGFDTSKMDGTPFHAFAHDSSTGFGGNGFGGGSNFGDSKLPARNECPVCHNDLEDMDHSDCQAELKEREKEKGKEKEKEKEKEKASGSKPSSGDTSWGFGSGDSIANPAEPSTTGYGDSSAAFEVPLPKPKATETAVTSQLGPKLAAAKPLVTKKPLLRKSTALMKPPPGKTIPTKLKVAGSEKKSDIKSLIKQSQEAKKKEADKTVAISKAPSETSTSEGFSFGNTSEERNPFESSSKITNDTPATTVGSTSSSGGSKLCPVCQNDLEDMDHSSCQEDASKVDEKSKDSGGFDWGGGSGGNSFGGSETTTFGETSSDKGGFAFGDGSGGFGATSSNDAGGFNWSDTASSSTDLTFGSSPSTNTNADKNKSSKSSESKKPQPSSGFASTSSFQDPLKPDFNFGGNSTESTFGSGFGGSSTSEFSFGGGDSSSTSLGGVFGGTPSNNGGFSFGGSEPAFGSSSPKKNGASSSDASAASKFKVPSFGSSASGSLPDNPIFGGFGGGSSSADKGFTFGESASSSSGSNGGVFGSFGGTASDSGFSGFGSTNFGGSSNNFGGSSSGGFSGGSDFTFGQDSGSSGSSGGFGGGNSFGSGGGFGSSSGNDFGGSGFGSNEDGGFSVGKRSNERKMVRVKRRQKK